MLVRAAVLERTAMDGQDGPERPGANRGEAVDEQARHVLGRRVVVAPSGGMLFAAGADGVVAVRTGDLSVARHDLIGSRVDALGLSPDGTTLFVLLHDGGRIAALDAATGAVLGFVPGGGFDRLLAVAPW